MASPGTKRRIEAQAELSAENRRFAGVARTARRVVRTARAEKQLTDDLLARILKDIGRSQFKTTARMMVRARQLT